VPSLPDFDLAPLQYFDPATLLGGKDSADAFAIVLAIAYNDLKDEMWFLQQLETGKPDTDRLTATLGQWQGMRVHINRNVLGIVHELIVAIESAQTAGILEDKIFAGAVRVTSDDAQQAWADLVAVATRDDRPSELREYLGRVRNRVAFHYDRTRLWEGYRSHFVARPKDASNESAFVSLGDQMESTRFYYADAAAQQAYEMFDAKNTLMTEANRHIKAMNITLREIVVAYVELRGRNARVSSAPEA
jgi:hypothetical protein